MVDPGTAMLIATAVATAAKGASDAYGSQQSRKAGKRRAKEMRRETQADLLREALQGSAELQGQGINSSNRLSKRRAQSSQDTSDLLRGALNI